MEFFGALLAYELPLGEFVLRGGAVILPWLELVCGTALLGNVWPETLRPLVFVQCLGFVLVLGQALGRGLEVSCGCFGGSADHWSAQPAAALARASLLLAGAGYLLVARDRPDPNERAGPTRAGTGA